MSFLTLNGEPVRCRRDQTQQKDNEHRLDRARMFDGTARMTRNAVYREFDVTTALLTTSERDTVRALINTNAALLTANGDLVGGEDVAVMPVPGTWTPFTTGNGLRWQGRFQLWETPSLLPPDTSATLWTALIGGVGLYQDFDGTASGTGDPVFQWQDQSGNDRHANVQIGLGAVPLPSGPAPIRDGSSVLFGPLDPTVSMLGFWSTAGGSVTDLSLTEAEMMIAFKASADPQSSNAYTIPWNLMRDGGRLPSIRNTDGHLYDSFGLNEIDPVDLGAPADDLAASYNVYNVSGKALDQWIARLNGVALVTRDYATDPFDFLLNSSAAGIGGNPADGFKFSGWIKHFIITAGVMTPSQRRSWYDFMRGATDDPPLPE